MLGRVRGAEMKSVRFSFWLGLERPGGLQDAVEEMWESLLEVTPLLKIWGLHQTRT